MLEPTPYPGHKPALAKLAALEAFGGAAGRPVLPPINVTFYDRANQMGVRQPACTLCGECVSGATAAPGTRCS
jgi:hypothetical protein